MFILATIITLASGTQNAIENLEPSATSAYENISTWVVKTYNTAYTIANTK